MSFNKYQESYRNNIKQMGEHSNKNNSLNMKSVFAYNYDDDNESQGLSRSNYKYQLCNVNNDNEGLKMRGGKNNNIKKNPKNVKLKKTTPVQKTLPIQNLRTFHNFVKSKLLKNNNLEKEMKLLDLAVGRGSDLHKWINNNITCVFGFDIGVDYIKEANRRYESVKESHPNFDFKFFVQNLSSPTVKTDVKNILEDASSRNPSGIPTLARNPSGIPTLAPKKFDIVSCQQAIHYFFESEEILDNLIKIVSTYLKKGGIFAVTTLDGDILKKRFMKSGELKNDVYVIRSNIDTSKDASNYGNSYYASLGTQEDKGSYFVNNESFEYLVIPNELVKICNKHKLELKEKKNFKEHYEEYERTRPIYKYMSDNEKEYSFMNVSFIFEKK